MAVLLVGTQMLGWNAPGVDSTGLGVGQAFAAHLSQGGLLAWLGFAGPMVGLFFVRSRDLSIRVLLGVLLLVLMGLSLGYLRDHHIRFMTVPAVLCWGMLPWNAWVVMVFGPLFGPKERCQPRIELKVLQE